MRLSEYLDKIVDQDHRAIKRIVRPMLGFKSIRCARRPLPGIETMRMIRNGHLNCPEGDASSAPNQIYSLTS
jgi:transposase-like protein